MNNPITVQTTIAAPVEKVWSDFTNPEAITQWNAASDDWHTSHAENDLREGGRFLSRMEAKDGSEGFDFTGVYTAVEPNKRIAYTMDDGRKAEVTFASEGEGTLVATQFEAESENPREMQQAGWQAILDSFKRYVKHHTA